MGEETKMTLLEIVQKQYHFVVRIEHDPFAHFIKLYDKSGDCRQISCESLCL